MAANKLAHDFKEFLKLLQDARVEYLLIGGYAVGYYGYPRATMDMDVWIAVHPANAAKMSNVMQRFGFPARSVPPETFLRPGEMMRLGVAPVRLEILTEISGVKFQNCWHRRRRVRIDGSFKGEHHVMFFGQCRERRAVMGDKRLVGRHHMFAVGQRALDELFRDAFMATDEFDDDIDILGIRQRPRIRFDADAFQIDFTFFVRIAHGDSDDFNRSATAGSDEVSVMFQQLGGALADGA